MVIIGLIAYKDNSISHDTLLSTLYTTCSKISLIMRIELPKHKDNSISKYNLIISNRTKILIFIFFLLKK